MFEYFKRGKFNFIILIVSFLIIFHIYHSIIYLAQATLEDITSAYRRLSRLYHPDKHTDNEQKRKADLLFNKIKKAYEGISCIIIIIINLFIIHNYTI